MAALLRGRVSKLETQNRPPARIRNTVLSIDALTGDVIGITPKGPCMIVYHYGSDLTWERNLLEQQSALVAAVC